MCNARNHPKGCTCGWGGEGHLGRSGGGYPLPAQRASTVVLNSQYRLAVSFTIPNANCPVCGCPVFFYQSPHGGRVYFDELGPPWPKHSCTDNTSAPSNRRMAVTTVHSEERNLTESSPHRPQWAADGWTPFICKKVDLKDLSVNYCQLNGLLGDKQVVLYLCMQRLPDGALMQVKQRHPNQYDVAMVWFEPATGRIRGEIFTAFLNQLQAIAWRPHNAKAKGPSGGQIRIVKSDNASNQLNNPRLVALSAQDKRIVADWKKKRGQTDKTTESKAQKRQGRVAGDTNLQMKAPNKFVSTMLNAFQKARAKK